MVKVSYTPPPERKKKGNKLNKIAKSKPFWLGIIVILAGVVIITASFHIQSGPSYIRKSTNKSFEVTNAVANTYKFTLKANTSVHMTFNMPINDTLHYYVSNQTGVYGLPHLMFGGNVENNSIVNVSSYVNMSAVTNATFYILTMNSYSSQSFNVTVTLVQETPIKSAANNDLVEIGALVAIAGIAVAWVSASRATKR